MNVKDAVTLAKDHVNDLFAAEGIINLGLEEVEYDDVHEQWHITLGFSRTWNQQGVFAALSSAGAGRTYKVVIIDPAGKPLSVKNRETANAG